MSSKGKGKNCLWLEIILKLPSEYDDTEMLSRGCAQVTFN